MRRSGAVTHDERLAGSDFCSAFGAPRPTGLGKILLAPLPAEAYGDVGTTHKTPTARRLPFGSGGRYDGGFNDNARFHALISRCVEVRRNVRVLAVR